MGRHGPPAKRVRIFTTPICSYCRIAKAYLRDNDITFEEVDITTDACGRREMVTMTGQYGVPVLLVGEKTLVGWNATEFERLLHR
jgi:glutaredoxin